MRLLASTTVVSMLLAAAAWSQAASYKYIDQTAPYKNPSPAMLTALNLPKLGQVFRVSVPASNPLGWTWYVLALGIKPTKIEVSAWQGYLYVVPSVVTMVPKGNGSYTFSYSIPQDKSLLGQAFYQQVLWGSLAPRIGRAGHGVVGT